MKIDLKIYCFLLINFIAVSSFIYSQDVLKNQFEYAHNLFLEEKYFDSITELKRLLFFDVDSQYNYRANELIAQSYKMGGKFSDAIRYFTIAQINAENIEEIFHAKTEIIRVNILRRTTSNALKLLDQLEKNDRFSNKINEINYWRGWAYIFADEWDLASNEFGKINQDHELKLLAQNVDDKKYSVTAAEILSYVIPGAGQFYTGNYLSGLLSLGWNVLWGYISINSFIEERIFDGLMVTNFLWLRFYRGNIENAEKFAVKKNIEIANKALYYLQYEFDGIKP